MRLLGASALSSRRLGPAGRRPSVVVCMAAASSNLVSNSGPVGGKAAVTVSSKCKRAVGGTGKHDSGADGGAAASVPKRAAPLPGVCRVGEGSARERAAS